MKLLIQSLIVAAALAGSYALADTLELADGTLLEGDFVGSSNDIVMFNTGTGIEAFPEAEVVGIYLSSGVATAQKEAEQAQQQPNAPTQVVVASGTRLVIRTADTVDSKRHKTGHRFRGQLESAIAVDGMTVIPRGTFVYGQVVQASQGGRAVGSSEMTVTFTDIMIDDQLYEIATGGLKAKTGNEAKKTVGRTARFAAIGGLAKGSKGAKNMAKAGVGVSILTSGSSINIPAGTLLETNLRVPLTVPL